MYPKRVRAFCHSGNLKVCPNGACVLVADTKLEGFSLALCVSRKGSSRGRLGVGDRVASSLLNQTLVRQKNFWLLKIEAPRGINLQPIPFLEM